MIFFFYEDSNLARPIIKIGNWSSDQKRTFTKSINVKMFTLTIYSLWVAL